MQMLRIALPCRTLLSGVLLTGTAALAGCQTSIMLRDQGQEALAQGNYQVAQEQFQRAIEKNATSYLTHYYLGLSYLKARRPLDAQLAFERARTLASSTSEKFEAILDGIAESLYQQKQYDNLHQFLEKSAGYYGETDDYLRQARYLVKTGDLDAARVAFRKAAYFAPSGDARPYLALAEFYESLNDVPRAVEALRYAYHVNPQNPEIADRLRRFGIVPGPTVAAEPPKPELLR